MRPLKIWQFSPVGTTLNPRFYDSNQPKKTARKRKEKDGERAEEKKKLIIIHNL